MQICKVCGREIHPAYAATGSLCEDCFADNAERYRLPGAVSYATRPMRTRKEKHVPLTER